MRAAKRFPILGNYSAGRVIMIPMAIPSFGGMLIEVITMLVVPVLYCWRQERKATTQI